MALTPADRRAPGRPLAARLHATYGERGIGDHEESVERVVFARDGGLQPGWSAGAFLGARHYNAVSSFDGSYGLRADARFGLGARAERTVVVAAQFDLTILAAFGAWR